MGPESVNTCPDNRREGGDMQRKRRPCADGGKEVYDAAANLGSLES